MSSKAWSFIIIILNMLGVLCLVYFSIPYYLHDINVTNPEAMIPFQKWEASGFILTFGLIPLVVVNIKQRCDLREILLQMLHKCHSLSVFIIVLDSELHK